MRRLAPPPASVNQAQTKGEAEVLQNLGQRRVALDARERDLALREQLMSATEKRVSEHLAELKSLEAKLGTMLAERDAAEEAQLASLVKTYENMKAADAAKIFNKLDRQVMLSLAQRMKPAKIGGIMAAMEPARAQDLTVMLALEAAFAQAAGCRSAPRRRLLRNRRKSSLRLRLAPRHRRTVDRADVAILNAGLTERTLGF